MTPGARLSAAMAVLDRVLGGTPAEQALTNWARGSRYAGSGDREAVRDLVFGALRCRRSFAALGTAETGRGLILGGLRAAGIDPAPLFTGIGHAPAPVTEAAAPETLPELVALDCPDWLAPALRESLGPAFAPVMQALRHRAPVFLRVDVARLDVETARKNLEAEGIETEPHPLAAAALLVTGGARRIRGSQSYARGEVEVQDAASQAVVEALPLRDGQRVLDLCAGGGGKTLAMAARARLHLAAHDIDPARMRDLAPRAERAGIVVAQVATAALASLPPPDLVLVDAPCSGSGSWRRAPEAKWMLGPERLEKLCAIQSGLFVQAAALLRPGGFLCYATCSLVRQENEGRIEDFLGQHRGWTQILTRSLSPLDGGDGFFLAVLRRDS